MSADWENCKENVQPIKRGRNVNALGDKLKPAFGLSNEAENDKQRVYFEAQISKAKEQSTSDEPRDANQEPGLLEVYLLYFKWIRDTYPSAADKALHILEKATCDMKEDEKIKNDPRYIKLWIEYVSEVEVLYIYIYILFRYLHHATILLLHYFVFIVSFAYQLVTIY
jgi:hypothetical protein